MRQRFFMGRKNYKEYGEALGGPEGLFGKNGIYVQSTNLYRTLYSGYSALHGFWTQSGGAPTQYISDKQVMDLNSTGLGLPPFLISRKTQLNSQLKNASTSDGFIPLIVYTYNNDNNGKVGMLNDLSYSWCDYVS